jgi:RDD family
MTYAAGFIFGALRETFVTPRHGRLAATLIEMPLMLTVSYVAAHHVLGRFDTLPGTGDKLLIGTTAFLLLLAAEIALSRAMRGWSLGRWLDHLKTAEGAVSIVMFGLFAVMPLLSRLE